MTEVIEKRIKTLNSVLLNKKYQDAVEKDFLASKGDWTTASASLKDKLPEETFKKVSFAHSLANWSSDNFEVVKTLAKQSDLTNMRDVALRYNPDRLASIVDPKDVPEATAGTTDDEKKRNFAVALHRKLFDIEPTAVLQRMIDNGEIPIADTSVSSGVSRVLNNLPDFNIRTTSIYKAFKQPEAFEGVPDEQRAGVIQKLKHLSLMTAISPIPEAVSALMKANLTSSYQVAEMPEAMFLKKYSSELGEDTAVQVYTNAINNRIRTEHALISMREAVCGTGLAAIDGKKSTKVRMTEAQKIAKDNGIQINLETLFGSIDYCECGECNSVYSPAAYFVELLQFLRNNNLGPIPNDESDDPAKNPNIHPDIKNTPLEMLFRRRPDLGNLELTCQNTNTILPYIDLVNEVMESFVVHLQDYRDDYKYYPQQVKIDVFNVVDETSNELLAQPQHINYEAYFTLKNEVYPFTLPYHQPIDAIRIFLNYLGTSHYELLECFRAANETVNVSPSEQEELDGLHKVFLDRAVDAEFLGLTQEEYIILTKEAFQPKKYFEITQKKAYTDIEYWENIGVKPTNKYYGYNSCDPNDDMLNFDEDLQIGLTFVKKQFLPRTGIQYDDLVELLKTRFINPNYPQGKSLKILESIRSSYHFLQTLVDNNYIQKEKRFAKLIDFLENPESIIHLPETVLNFGSFHTLNPDNCIEKEDLRQWVYYNFDIIGKLIVLESEEGLQLPIHGEIFSGEAGNITTVGILLKDGTIKDKNGATVGYVTLTIGRYVSETEKVVDLEGNDLGSLDFINYEGLRNNAIIPIAKHIEWKDNEFRSLFGYKNLYIKNLDQQKPYCYSYLIRNGELVESRYVEGPIDYLILPWSSVRNTCNIDRVRLKHLDGTPLVIDEYDRMQCFIRLWRKMGWTIDDTDKAIIGLTEETGWTIYKTDKALIGIKGNRQELYQRRRPHSFWWNRNVDVLGCFEEDINYPRVVFFQICKITPDFLHQLVAVRKLLDLTGLPLEKLLTFWTDISTSGEKSLYSRLFLTHNLLAIDEVFKSDENGNYLTQSAKLTEHIPVLMAALKLKADDISEIMTFCNLKDELTLRNVSILYRHSLLSKILNVKVADLKDLFSLFGTPFDNAHETLKLLEVWGKMEDSGFTFRQLNYLIQGQDDELRPLTPSKKTILTISKTIYDGLNTIYQEHPDIQEDKKEELTTDLVRTKASLIFEQDIVEKIIGLLEGTTVYTTNAPANQTIIIPDSLAKKLKYINPKGDNYSSANIQVTGILTDKEKSQAMALCANTEWHKAIERVGKRPNNIFNEALIGIFSNLNEAKDKLLSGDISSSDTNTAAEKRFYFLRSFLPFLRKQLNRRFLVDTMSGATGMTRSVTEVLLSEILVVGTDSQSAMNVLENIGQTAAGNMSGWKGYLIPPAEGSYTFIAITDNQPLPLSIDGKSVQFPIAFRQEDPSNVWLSESISLKGGALNWLELTDRTPNQLQWKTSSSSKITIPTSVLLPDYSTAGTEEVLIKLFKAALLVNGFNLRSEEVSYWQEHSADFDTFDLNTVKLESWKHLQAYTNLRDSLPKFDTTLLDLFKWASKPDDVSKLSEKISSVTGWKKDRIDKLLTPDHFNMKSEDFCNEVSLIKLKKALDVADKIGIDINKLFEWAKPGSKFWECHQIAEDIRNAARARFDQDDWEQVVKPLNNQLREHQKQALISYLLVQKELRDCGVIDADSLFEFFLIDVQMGACMETSRIKQAISSVQLFIQRCLLGEEKDYGVHYPNNKLCHGVPNTAIDRDRWEWMQKYRVWEANRKVYLYPENWIEPQLRDDKSPFYKELESELLQKDINTQTVEDAMKSYLFKVDEVANLKVVGLFLDDQEKKLHIFSRTRNAPYFFYYRYYDIAKSDWYPWEKVQVDIPNYDVENISGQIIENGTYLVPVVWNKRLLIFFPQFAKKTKTQRTDESINVVQKGSSMHVPANRPFEVWEIKMAWSEYRNKKWTQKQVSSDTIYDLIDIHLFDWDKITWSHEEQLKLKTFLKLKWQTIDWIDKLDFEQNGNVISASYESEESNAFYTFSLTLDDEQTKVDLILDLQCAECTILGSERLTVNRENDVLKIYSKPINNCINLYEFIPRIVENPSQIVIDVYKDNPAIGSFRFAGSQLSKDTPLVGSKKTVIETDFHYSVTTEKIHSLQASNTDEPFLFNSEPYFDDKDFYSNTPQTGVTAYLSTEKILPFSHTFAHDLLGKLMAGNLNDLFDYYRSNVTHPEDAFGADEQIATIYNELNYPYSLYNWEAAFHAPMLLTDRLLKSQQFDHALKMCHYIFNPLAEDDGIDEKYVWQFLPFKIEAKDVLEQLFLNLQPNTPDTQINEWRDKPFQPHVIARSRPSAYMKWVVMKYIEILIAYGDYYFRQNTLETIPMATQCYVLAAHIYGTRGHKIPKRGKLHPQTYNSLLDKWDAFSNAMVEMELAFPFSSQSPTPFGVSNGVIGLPNIFGFATSLYFCIPDNPNLRSLRDTIDDRLFKIRHCQDIEGVFRKLPLFEPPVDPALLVQAAAQGLSLSSVLNDLNSPMPNYRFYYLLQKALELCSELKALGNTFLSAKEKGDAEALSQLRAKHESSIHNLVMEVRKQQLEEAQKSLEALQQSRKGPESRMQYHLKLIGEDLGKVPDDNTDFSELPNQIEQPVNESGLRLIQYEKEELDKASEAAGWQTGIGIVETLGSVFHALPTFNTHATPMGVGAAVSWGFPHMGNATQSTARGLKIYSDYLSYQSTNAGRKGGFLRQLQDRVQQANAAGHEIKSIDKQILTQQIRINIAQQEITNQQKQIDNAQEVEEYLRNKYTNQELYSWMEGSIRELYYQAYTLAYDLAKRTEKVYRFERGLNTSNFIQFGYWDASHDGLLAGERLYIGLKQLEATYQEKRGYDYEITKHISLRQVNPLALLELKENGICEFALPEMLFDMDHPGHYMRRIKSVALTVPCVVGPYTSLNCTLRLLEHKFRINAFAKDKSDYTEKMDESEERFSTVNVPITSISVSTGQNDSGVFELNFRDERYIPFEGAGAISKWRIELPAEFRQFDYDTISDVVMHLRYTAVEGGDKLKAAATGSVQEYIKNVEELSKQEGLFAVFDLKHEFPDEWYKATNLNADATERLLKLNNLNERLPIFTKSRKVNATDIYLVSSSKIEASKLILTQGSDEYTFTDGALPIGAMNSFAVNDIECSINSWQLKIQDVETEFDKLWLIVRYKM